MDDESNTHSLARPSITFESLTFSNATTINLEPQDIVVFVGPNNAGKSAALREIEQHVGRHAEPTVMLNQQ